MKVSSAKWIEWDIGWDIEIIASLLEDRKLRVKIRHEKSAFRTPEAGIPQGAMLSPHLHNIYTAHILKPHYPEHDSIMALYADNMAIEYQSK